MLSLAQFTNSFQRSRIVRSLVMGALLSFVFAKALVPPGFMLSDGSSQSLYMLCHGDLTSRALLAMPEKGASSERLNTNDMHHDHVAHIERLAHAEHLSEQGMDGHDHGNTASSMNADAVCLSAVLTLTLLLVLAGWLAFAYTRLTTRYSFVHLYLEGVPRFQFARVRAPPQKIAF